MSNTKRIAIIDLYDGVKNEGMRCIKGIIQQYSDQNDIKIIYEVFELRNKNEIPDLNFDAYISSGGPGSPLDTADTEWEKQYFLLMNSIRDWNLAHSEQPKNVFLICHSFQIFSRYYKFGKVSKRYSTSFGIFPMHITKRGQEEQLFSQLTDPFWGVDSRDYQVIQPNYSKLRRTGGSVICIEKNRPHVPLERAVMAMRFNKNFFGTQFHPEADPVGMLYYLNTDEKKSNVIENHGIEKYNDMIDHLNDPDKIVLTHSTILPAFLELVVGMNEPVLS